MATGPPPSFPDTTDPGITGYDVQEFPTGVIEHHPTGIYSVFIYLEILRGMKASGESATNINLFKDDYKSSSGYIFGIYNTGVYNESISIMSNWVNFT